MFVTPLLNLGGVFPPLDGRTPVFIELGADPRVSPGFDAPPGSICRFGTTYLLKVSSATTDWEELSPGALTQGQLWEAQVRSFADQYLGTAMRRWQFLKDFHHPPNTDLSVSLSGTATFNNLTNPARGGLARVSTGAASGSQVRWLSLSSTPILSGGATEKWVFAVRGRLQGVVDSETNHMIGFTDSTSGIEQARFGVSGAVSTTAWVLKAKTPAGVTGGAIDTNWHDFYMVNDGANLRLFVDGTQVATVSSSSLDSISFRPDSIHTNGANTADRQFDYDKVLIIGEDVTA